MFAILAGSCLCSGFEVWYLYVCFSLKTIKILNWSIYKPFNHTHVSRQPNKCWHNACSNCNHTASVACTENKIRKNYNYKTQWNQRFYSNKTIWHDTRNFECFAFFIVVASTWIMQSWLRPTLPTAQLKGNETNRSEKRVFWDTEDFIWCSHIYLYTFAYYSSCWIQCQNFDI